MSYVYAIEFKPCSKEVSDLCIDAYKYGKCKPERCQYPYKNNPLCFSDYRSCGHYDVRKIGDKTYILYNCPKACHNFLGCDEKKLSKLKLNNIIYGKDLDELLSKIKKKTTKTTSKHNNDLEYLKRLLENLVVE